MTWPHEAFSLRSQFVLNPRPFSNFGRLPTRVIVVCHVALPNRSIAQKVMAIGGHQNIEVLARLSRLGVALGLKEDWKDMVMNSRAFLCFTLVPLFWFSASALTTTGHPGGVSVAASQDVKIQTPTLMEKAQAGDAEAEYRIGWSYFTGKGVSVDYKEAARWLRLSAAQDFPDAEFALGYAYEHGTGVRKDAREAVRYYTAAAKHANSTAENNLASMYQHGQGVRKDLHQAAAWYQRAAEQGNVVAQCNLASMYFRGEGLTRDYSHAAKWFRSAAERGYAPAQENFAWMSYTGTGLKLDYAEAAKWTRAAAEQGFARAQLDLAYLYEKGRGVPLDYVSAYMWYKTASDSGERQARRELKSVSAIMTDLQIKQAVANAEKLPRSRPPIQEGITSETIGSPFIQKH